LEKEMRPIYWPKTEKRILMGRVLRNYIISFIIIGLFFLVVQIINDRVEQRMGEKHPAPETSIPPEKK